MKLHNLSKTDVQNVGSTYESCPLSNKSEVTKSVLSIVQSCSKQLGSKTLRFAVVLVGAAYLIRQLTNSSGRGHRVLVFDAQNTHQNHVGYVLEQSIISEADIHVDYAYASSKENEDIDLCEISKQLETISKSKNKPLVINFSFGSSAIDLTHAYLDQAIRQLERQYGKETQVWPDGVQTHYKKYIKQVTRASVNQIFNQLYAPCDKRSNGQNAFHASLKKLVSNGVNVVFAVGNSGQLIEDLVRAGDIPKKLVPSMTHSIFFTDGHNLPDGVIVVGGAIKNTQGQVQADPLSMPNGAVDLVAFDQNVQVDPKGTTDSGTSFAAPKVSALVASLRALSPSFSAIDAERLIKSQAQKITGESNNKVGMGLIQAEKVIKIIKESRSSE